MLIVLLDLEILVDYKKAKDEPLDSVDEDTVECTERERNVSVCVRERDRERER